MDTDAISERLTGEQQRLAGVRDGLTENGGAAADSESASLSELSDADQHPADVGTETFNRERDMAILEQVEAELADVERALERLEAGTYGTCEACGRPIGDARLDAVPATRFCLEDELAAERGA